jgi:hypothetical protein
MEIAIVILVIGAAWLMLTGSGIMGNLSASDIAGYASNAGFQGSDLVMAVAVALAESSGDPNAVGDKVVAAPYGSVGLWQINTKAHPEYDHNQLTDPQYNANAAHDIYQRAGGFSPWSTYSNGMASNNFAAASAGVTAMQQASGDTQSA